MDQMEEKRAQWRRILKGEETFSDPEEKPRTQARLYHTEHMLADVLEQTRERYIELHGEPRVETLVSMVGFSPETTIQATYVLRPRRLVLIYSQASQRQLDFIYQQIVDRFELLAYREIVTSLCEAADPKNVYQVIRSKLNEARQLLGRPEGGEILDYIDITGGKKVMSAASALVAWQLDLNICYLNSKYDDDVRLPKPGSEALVRLDNPMSIFGDQELEVGAGMFDAGNFVAAHEHFARLEERVLEPSQARALRHLSALYAAWCDLDLERLPEHLRQVRQELAYNRLDVGSEATPRLRTQLDYLEELTHQEAPEQRRALILSYYLLGEHYRNQGRADFAALLFYRTMESVLQLRLELAHQIDPSKGPRGESPETRKAWRELAVEVYDMDEEPTELPHRLGFMDAALLLEALSDELLERAHMNGIKSLKHLRSLSEQRNRSVLAHGHRTISAEKLSPLAHHALTLLRVFARLHGDQQIDEGRLEQLRFVQLN